jgi:hypothetical protein
MTTLKPITRAVIPLPRPLAETVRPETSSLPVASRPSSRLDRSTFDSTATSVNAAAALPLASPETGTDAVAATGTVSTSGTSAAQEHAQLLLERLSTPKTPEQEAALVRLLKSAGLDVALAKDPVALVTPENAAQVAKHLASRGLPLDGAGLKAFQRQRLMAPQDGMTGKLAYAYAKAVRGRETLFKSLGTLDDRQEKSALRIFRGMGSARAARMLGALGVKVAVEGDELVQKRRLGNVFVSGEAIRTLAREAKVRGISLTPAGIEAFKKKHGLGRGSELDGPTLRRLQIEVGPIGRRPKGEQAKADWYRRIVEAQGGTWRRGEQQLNVVGLRGYDVKTGVNRNAFGKWNDTLAFIWKNKNGKWEVREFRGTTDPGKKRYADNDDYNGDGRPDTAHLRPGQYPYRLGTHRGYYGAGNPTYNVQVDRDFNGDGKISAAERRESIRRDTRGYGINHHWQFFKGDVGTNSVGCQVAKVSYAEYRRKITPLWKMNRGLALYTLVEAKGALS